MVVLDIGDYGQIRIQLEEGAVAFVGLCHYETALAITGVAAQAAHLAADDNRRVDAAFSSNAGNHRTGRGLAMRTGNSYAVSSVHNRCQNIAAVQHGNAALSCCHQLRIVRMDSSGNNYGLCIINLAGCMAHENHSALLRQMCRHMACVEVRTADIIAALDEHIRNSAHAGTTDADKMYVMQVS